MESFTVGSQVPNKFQLDDILEGIIMVLKMHFYLTLPAFAAFANPVEFLLTHKNEGFIHIFAHNTRFYKYSVWNGRCSGNMCTFLTRC